jgi:Hint domain
MSGTPSLLHANGVQFVNAQGQTVYLAGTETWNDAQSYTQPQFTFQQFSDFEAQTVDANFIRYWLYQASNDGDSTFPDSQLPFVRSSTPGAADGNQWDLTQYNSGFFTQLQQNVQIAAANGQYVDIILFPGSSNGTDPFTASNNIQGVGDGSLSDPAILPYQEAYIAQILNTVGHDSNVMFEVANETSPSDLSWQETIVNYVHSYEQQNGLLNQMVGITAFQPNSESTQQNMADLEGSNADWIEPYGWGLYGPQSPTPEQEGNKPVISADDHYGGTAVTAAGNGGWAWVQFITGNSVSYMDDMSGSGLLDPVYAAGIDATNGDYAAEAPARDATRLGIKETVEAANQLNLGPVTPQSQLSSTGFAMAGGGQYAVYAPSGGAFSVDLSGTPGALTATWYDVPTGQTQTATINGGSQASLTSPFGSDATGLVLLPNSDACFLSGTRILTEHGEVAVEDLREGDGVITLDGEKTVVRPIRWIGHRQIDLTAHPKPETMTPIRIRRDAVADNVPHRDLLVSADHAIFIGGKLIPARMLVNGATIVEDGSARTVRYFHVELDRHAVLVAEGLPAESYLDTGNRAFFANAGLATVLHPDLSIGAGRLGVWERDACAPLVTAEADVRPVWERLAARAATLGHAVALPATTSDAALRLVVDGRALRPISVAEGRYVFPLPRGARAVRLASRSGSPAESRPWLDDRRRLGVFVERVVVQSEAGVEQIPLDHPSMMRGWHRVEQRDGLLRRWTNGDATIAVPPRAAEDGGVLEIAVCESMRYPAPLAANAA